MTDINSRAFGQMALQILQSANVPGSAVAQIAEWQHIAQGIAQGGLVVTAAVVPEPQDHSV